NRGMAGPFPEMRVVPDDRFVGAAGEQERSDTGDGTRREGSGQTGREVGVAAGGERAREYGPRVPCPAVARLRQSMRKLAPPRGWRRSLPAIPGRQSRPYDFLIGEERFMSETLFAKVWTRHVIAATDQATLLYIDRHLVHEVTSPQAFDGLRLAGRRVRRPDLTFATVDHNVPTENQLDIRAPLSRRQVEALRANCREFGLQL